MSSTYNIQFSYMYRDADNYKLTGEMIFTVIGQMQLEKWDAQIRSKLIDGYYFDPEKWGVADIRDQEWDEGPEHGWFEYLGVEVTEEETNQEESWEEWLKKRT